MDISSAKIHKHLPEAVINMRTLYKTVEVKLGGVELFFTDEDTGNIIQQPWNQDYPNARAIFANSLAGELIRNSIHTQHQKLYEKGIFGAKLIGPLATKKLVVDSGDKFIGLVEMAQVDKPINIFTYVITLDGIMRFSRSSHKSFFIDLLSKHAVHSDRAVAVLYAGEFYLYDYNNRKVLVINNGSGTYGPKTNNNELDRLKSLLTYNFKDLDVVSVSYELELTEDVISEHLAR
jgi:hypothetical protein